MPHNWLQEIYPPSTCRRQHVVQTHAKAVKLHSNLTTGPSDALSVAAHMSHRYPALNELGLDLAVDQDLTPWILEVNTLPDPCPFTKLREQDTIQRIVAYGRAYGRRYPLNCTKSKQGE
ncbi:MULTISPECIES: YheC/YheD family protein [Paenibacillus]|uniref:YheC/YheD family protein n=1 Tax=Paenibacillus TaxID=44249 RepID=UPI001E55F2FA|nr:MULTISPECIES: YheC/YheD family protein [Paenibacillus]